jgi:hypothetical protein
MYPDYDITLNSFEQMLYNIHKIHYKRKHLSIY